MRSLGGYLVWLVHAAGFAATFSHADPFVFERSEAAKRRVEEESCSVASCPATQVEFKGEPKDAIFNQINAMEMASVVEYLKAEGVVDYNRGELPGANEALNSNYVMNFALQLPPKVEVLAYLDDDGPMPDRYCEVVVNRGAATPRDVMHYIVGPLVDGGVTDSTTYTPLLEDGTIPWAKRQLGPVDWAWLQDIVALDAFKLKDLLMETTGGYCYGMNATFDPDGCGFDDMTYWDYTSLDSTPDIRAHALHFWLAPADGDWGYVTLHPVPLSFNYIEDPDLPPDQWTTYNFEYCYQGPFDSAEDLMAAYEAGEITVCSVPNTGQGWSNTNPVEPLRMDSELPYPEVCSASGNRFSVMSAGEGMTAEMHERKLRDDKIRRELAERQPPRYTGSRRGGRNAAWTPHENMMRHRRAAGAESHGASEIGGDGSGHMVSWMDWSFHVSFDAWHGMVIRNLKFKGERIAYELSIQEYFASYSSIGSTAQVFYYDSNYEIGTELAELAVGIDCPANALYLPVLLQEFEAAGFTEPAHVCIFEQPYGEPMWRHYYAGGGAYPDGGGRGLPRTKLSVRAVSTMGNYDYLGTFSLMADGVVDMKMELGGYMLTSYAPDVMDNVESPLFGEKVHTNTNGVLHDHILGFKVDLDIGGTANTMSTMKVEYGTYEEVMGVPKPAWHSYDGVKVAKQEDVETEGEFFANDYDGFFIKGGDVNSWGGPKSYELAFDHTVHAQVFPPDDPRAKPLEWARSNVAVTKYKDEEKHCTYPSNFNVAGDPFAFADLATFKNGEAIVDEDLVFWIMVGKQHYPKAEDVPLVSNFGTGFTLKPRNVYDRAAFEDLADYVSPVGEGGDLPIIPDPDTEAPVDAPVTAPVMPAGPSASSSDTSASSPSSSASSASSPVASASSPAFSKSTDSKMAMAMKKKGMMSSSKKSKSKSSSSKMGMMMMR